LRGVVLITVVMLQPPVVVSEAVVSRQPFSSEYDADLKTRGHESLFLAPPPRYAVPPPRGGRVSPLRSPGNRKSKAPDLFRQQPASSLCSPQNRKSKAPHPFQNRKSKAPHPFPFLCFHAILAYI